MKSYAQYTEAQKYAQDLANQLKAEVGIEKMREFGQTVFNVRMLPKPENRQGWELCCEIVRPF